MYAIDQVPSTESPSPPTTPFRDRGTAILLVGLFVAFLGLCCLGMMALMSVSVAAASAISTAPAPSFRSLIPAVAVYLILAVFFLTTGIGSAMVKRWARAMLAVVSWMWLATGCMGFAMIVILLPTLRKVFESAAPAGQPGLPAGMMMGCMLAGLAVVYVALPLPLALFYSGKNVRATFEARDRSRWTDRLPTPLLGLFLVLAFSFVTSLALPLYGVIPAFGRLLSGASAWAFGLAFAAATGAGAWWVWHRSIRGWWTAVGIWAFGVASSILTLFGDFDWNAYYTQAGLTEQQLRMTRGLSPAELFENPLVLGLVAVIWIGISAVLFWTKKFFDPPATAA